MPISRESREQLGRALAEAREEAGLTVVELAQIASPGRAGGLSRYYDAEAGRRMATSETVSHYANALGRADLQDLRNKILSKRPNALADIARPASTDVDQIQDPSGGADHAGGGGVADTSAGNGSMGGTSSPAPTALADDDDWEGYGQGDHRGPSDVLPQPELLPNTLLPNLKELVAQAGPLEDGAIVRGRGAVLAAACSLLEEAIGICADDTSSVSVQVIQINPERTFTRNLGMSLEHSSRLFPFQLQRLVRAGGSVRHLLAHEIMHTLDMWSAFERFIALMELAGDYAVYWPSRHQSKARMPDYLVIENVAALEIYPTGALTWAGDAAIVHRNPAGALAIIKDYGENLIAEADEAFQVTDPSSTYAVEHARVWVEQAILDAEQTEATRFLFKYGLSTLTEPLKSYEKRVLSTYGLSLEDRASWPPWVKQDLELRRRRLANFLAHTKKHRAIDVVPMSALRYYVDHGQYSPNCAEFLDYVVPVPDRIRHLEDVITFISTNERYDLVVLEDDPPLVSLIGAGMVMMGRPKEEREPWKIFYQSVKPGPQGDPISVAFQTNLEMFRHRVGGRIASLENEADKRATQSTLRMLHKLIDELKAQ